MKKLKDSGSIMVLLFMCILFTARPVTANPIPEIEVSYNVRIDQEHLQITAELDRIHSKMLYIRFADSCAGVNDLTKRISRLKARSRQEGLDLPLKSLGRGLYGIQTKGATGICVSYNFHPRAANHNHNLTTLTSSYLHISGEDFLAGIFQRLQDAANFDNLLYRKCRVKFTSLPAGWKTLTTYPMTPDGWILVDNLNEVLLHVGDYQTITEKINGSLYTFAFDRKIKFNRVMVLKDGMQFIRYYNRIFKHTPVPWQLIVINQGREEIPSGYSMGGQGKKANIVMEIEGITGENQLRNRVPLAGFLGHEIFHIWITGAFNTKENFDWFWEGFTEYQTWRSMRELGLINQAEFNVRIAKKYIQYQNLKLKEKVSVFAASNRKFDPNPEYYALIYEKGALIAYLFDQRLREAGKDYNQFLAALYQEYAITQKPLGNQEVIAFMNEYLGDASFTRNYVLGTKVLPIAPWKAFGMNYAWAWLKSTPSPPFPLNLLIPLAVLALAWFGFKMIRKKVVRKEA